MASPSYARLSSGLDVDAMTDELRYMGRPVPHDIRWEAERMQRAGAPLSVIEGFIRQHMSGLRNAKAEFDRLVAEATALSPSFTIPKAQAEQMFGANTPVSPQPTTHRKELLCLL